MFLVYANIKAISQTLLRGSLDKPGQSEQSRKVMTSCYIFIMDAMSTSPACCIVEIGPIKIFRIGFAHPASFLLVPCIQSKALNKPAPVSSFLDESGTMQAEASLASHLVVAFNERSPIVPTAWPLTKQQMINAPFQYFPESVESTAATAAAIAQQLFWDSSKQEPLVVWRAQHIESYYVQGIPCTVAS